MSARAARVVLTTIVVALRIHQRSIRTMLRVGRRTGAAAVASLIAITVSLASAQWPQTCVPGNAWNATKCPAGATCCHDQFSVSTMGCCPWANAVCCPLDGCCPSGTKCVVAYESSFNTVYNCTAPDGTVVGLDRGVCKPGVMLPLDAVKKNVIVIGDSLSIGYLPSLRAALADIALVQHAPADTSDGGAEETAYGVQVRAERADTGGTRRARTASTAIRPRTPAAAVPRLLVALPVGARPRRRAGPHHIQLGGACCPRVAAWRNAAVQRLKRRPVRLTRRPPRHS